jgi:hypothetical protein
MEFKEKIYELIVDEDNQELNFENLSYYIQKWPEISYYNEEEDSMQYESLGTDNCSIVEIGDDYLELISGNEYQNPHLVRIEMFSGELSATYYKPSDFLIGLDYDEVVQILQS